MFKHSFSLSYIKTESEQVTSPCGTRQPRQPPGAAASLQNACFTLGHPACLPELQPHRADS